jgi:glycosyltransferase involved in cell wall biosynthesis
MKLSVVIPCFNAASTLGTQLEALARQRYNQDWEVIIADNGSTDGSLAVAESYKSRLPGLRVVDSSDRRGAAHARNIGALNSTGDHLLYCDADDEVAPGWMAAMAEALSRHELSPAEWIS